MNILFLSQIVPYPPHGGVLQRGYNIIREIAKDNNVYLLAFVHPDMLTSEKAISESKTHLEAICESVDYFTLWPKQSGLHKFIAFSAAFLYPLPFSTLAHRSASYSKKMQQIIENNNIDVVHFDTIGLAPYLKFSADLPTVMTHHNIESTLMKRRSEVEVNWLAQFYVRLQSQRLHSYEISKSPDFDINIMVSRNDEGELKAMSPSVLTDVVPNGVDTEYFTVRDDEQECSVIYTGGMNMFANKDAIVHLIYDIWPRVQASLPNAVFNIIGQDPTDEIIAISKKDKSINLLGYVDDIRPHVAKSSVYVVPLRVGGGTRLKVLDALSQGKAIVSTSVGCEGIEVTHGENIYIEDNDDLFADRVIELLNDKTLRSKLGCKARSLAESKYAWSSIALTLNKAYHTVTSKKQSADQ